MSLVGYSASAWLLADAAQHCLPLSQSLLLIPLALKGYTGARPQRCTKVAIAGELENAFRQRLGGGYFLLPVCRGAHCKTGVQLRVS